MYNLAIFYYNGEGVEQSYKKAVEYLQKSAEKGYAPAQNFLGECYRDGVGIAIDLTKAKECFHNALVQGNKNAAINIQKINNLEVDK